MPELVLVLMGWRAPVSFSELALVLMGWEALVFPLFLGRFCLQVLTLRGWLQALPLLERGGGPLQDASLQTALGSAEPETFYVMAEMDDPLEGLAWKGNAWTECLERQSAWKGAIAQNSPGKCSWMA